MLGASLPASLMDPTLLQSKLFLVICAAVVVVAGLAVWNTVVAERWRRAGKDIGSILEFKYLHPIEIRPDGRYPFLLFISSIPTGTPTPSQLPDIVEVTIQKQIERLLQENRSHYRESNTYSNKPVPRNKYLKIRFRAKGLRFDPQETKRLHSEELVIQHFQVIADKRLEGRTIRGILKASVGWFTVAELGFEIRVSSDASCEPFEVVSAPIRRDIFPSYAREDATYLEEFEKYFKVFGDEYISDVKKIRAGTRWPEEIKSLINQADLFQLFWSHNAANSDYIPKEVEHAVALKRKGFIYQTIWENDSPPLPAGFEGIQATHVSLERKKQKKSSSRRAFVFAPLLAASGSSANATVPTLATAGGVLALSVTIGLGGHWIIKKARASRQQPVSIETPHVDQPSRQPELNRDPPPPPSAPVSGQVLANNEGVGELEVKLCPQQQPSSKCSSTKTDRRGHFSFSTVDKALKYNVTVSTKDWACVPPRHSLSDLNVPQNVRFACRKTVTPSPSALEASVVWDVKVGPQFRKKGESVIVTVQIKNEGGSPATNLRVQLEFPSFVEMLASRLEAQQSKNQQDDLKLVFVIPSLAAGELREWDIKLGLTRDLIGNEYVWVERYPIEYRLHK